MSTRIALSLLLSSLMALAWATVARPPVLEASAADRSASPASVSTGPATPTAPAATIPAAEAVFLRGPFGRVPAGTPAEPAAVAPMGTPLDAFVRRAPLVIETEPTAGMTLLEVLAQPLDALAEGEVLSSGKPVFEGPDGPGSHLLVATVQDGEGTRHHVAWLVAVPDREPPPDGLYDIPAPEVVIESAQGQTTGLTGSGCYAYLCVDSGGLPPVSSLGPLPVRVSETMGLRLSDGSAITAWEGSLSRLDGDGRPLLEASGVLTGSAAGQVALAGLEAPAAGEWLLELKVVFDRERGWLWTVYRLTVD